MISAKTKQLLRTLKWQALVVSGQDIDKMDTIFQCLEFFINLNALAMTALKHLTFVWRLKKKDVKYVKEFKQIRTYLYLLSFLGPFNLVLLLPTADELLMHFPYSAHF